MPYWSAFLTFLVLLPILLLADCDTEPRRIVVDIDQNGSVIIDNQVVEIADYFEETESPNKALLELRVSQYAVNRVVFEVMRIARRFDIKELSISTVP